MPNIRTKRDGTLTLAALAGGAFNLVTGALNPGAESLEITAEPGDFSLTIPQPTVLSFLDRGEIPDPPQLAFGDDQGMSWSFSCHLKNMSEAASATIGQIITRSGYVAANWEATNAAVAGCARVPCFDLKWENPAAAPCGDLANIIIVQYCWITGDLAEGDPNTFSVKGQSYSVLPTII